ncbi:MAG: hypothetical protein VW238_01065 [Nitrosomonadales bacterium]
MIINLTKKIIFIFLIIPIISFAQTISNLKNPESAVFDNNNNLFVTEIGDFDIDQDGKILKFDSNLNQITFCSGLDDPKGITLYNDNFYVTDKNKIWKISSNGEKKIYINSIDFAEEPKFLNDIDHDNQGGLFVTDSGDLKSGGKIFYIDENKKITILFSDNNPNIKAPNGIYFVNKERLLTVDFETGILSEINPLKKTIQPLLKGFGGGDGIEIDNEITYVSDFKSAVVYKINNGIKEEIYKGNKSAADIAANKDKTLLAIPDLYGGTLEIIKLK